MKPEHCQHCGVAITNAPTGRPRRYCVRSCRDAAYRRRVHDTIKALATGEVVLVPIGELEAWRGGGGLGRRDCIKRGDKPT